MEPSENPTDYKTAERPCCAGRRCSPKDCDDGFTLVEILIAIMLVGVLSVVAVVGITNLTSRGSAASCTASMDAARVGSAVYFTTSNEYPTTLQQMTTSTPPSLVLPPAATLNAVAVGEQPIGTVASTTGWTLTMSAGVAGGSPTFVCSSSAASATTTNAGSTRGTVACPGNFDNWVGEYYANIGLTGAATLCRDDVSINFDWAYGSPASNIPNDYFSARWTRSIVLAAGAHTFTVGSDDGSRLFVDGVLVLDDWNDHAYGTRSVSATLTAGAHTIVLEFYERGGVAAARLSWSA